MAGTTKAQYQHFVPQFLLRNFCHPYKPQNDDLKKSKRSKRKYEKGMFPGDPVVHNLNLSADLPVICEAPVKRILGQMDMYRDTSKSPPEQQQHIEQMFSKLEGQTSAIFRKITKAFEQGEKGLWLTRDERDLIRKFLFLLKYRGSGYHRRFYHDNAEGYNANDRELLREYMAEKGYKRPLDVWFDNLKTIMELRMDPDGKWMQDLPKRIFHLDAFGFITHVQSMYMAICTPSDPSDEFILADNSYNIFEGPNCFAADEDTGKVEGTAYTPLHEFAPISPKLMIVLRSLAIPVAEEDANANIKLQRDFFRSITLDKVYSGEVKSLLADLPIEKARNNYSEIVNGRLQLISGEDGSKRKDHRFCFKFFPIETQHVNKINGILLDNAYTCSSVVFKSIETFSRTIEWFLSASCTFGKIVMGDDANLRLTYLKKLAAISQSLGSEEKPVWTERAVPVVQGLEQFRLMEIEKDRLLGQMVKDGPKPIPDTKYMQVYKNLDGSEESICEDMKQARLMWKLRVKIDVWSQGLDESLRQSNRELLIEAYLQLPPRRVWLFVKHIRFAFLRQMAGPEGENELYDLLDSFVQGPEDVIAQGKYLVSYVYPGYTKFELACHIVRPEKVAQLMYKATMNDIKMTEHSQFNLWAPMTLELSVFEQIMALKLLTFIVPGPICDCGKLILGLSNAIVCPNFSAGVDEIEQLARKQEFKILRSGQYNQAFGNLILEDDEKVELLTRIEVSSRFTEVLSGKLEKSLLEVLKNMFFEIVYPTPPQ